MNRIRFGKSNKNEFSSIFKVNVGIALVFFFWEYGEVGEFNANKVTSITQLTKCILNMI
nr:hypothetical protein [Enterococcus faecium]